MGEHTIKAIETEYNGYRFRSRLEARWAVFFDAYGIEYEYEKEGFEVSTPDGIVRYLPDFYFPQYDMWGEVKGVTNRGQIPKEDAIKMSWMIANDGPCSKGIILLGNIPDPKKAEVIFWAKWRWDKNGLYYDYCTDNFNNTTWRRRESETAPHFFNDDFMVTHSDGDDIPKYRDNRIFEALTAARSARFEHGEAPKIKKLTEHHTVYLAGKIRQNGWREHIYRCRYVNDFDPDEPNRTVDVNENLTITGPFFISCDHGCYHGDGSHGVGAWEGDPDDPMFYNHGVPSEWPGCGELGLQRIDVVFYCKEQIDAAEIVFAYIDCLDCFGTLAEIGYAHAKGKTIIIKFGSDYLKEDMWFIDKMQQITCNVSNEWINTQLLSKLKEELNK